MHAKKQKKIPYGFLDKSLKADDQNIHEHTWDCVPKHKSELRFNLIVPEEDTMQYFIQWQRYRKFWWSSITSTPSLFSMDESSNAEKAVNIVAKFDWGTEIVEMINISENAMIQNTSLLSCTLPLENALFIILLDGVTSNTKEGYLHLHRKMAPYKMSFMLEKASKNGDVLRDLAYVLHCRLARNKISTLLPNFSVSNENQLLENLQMGVAYTIVLSDKTLSDGIFHLLNSSTMLKEQVHVADFDTYAALICEKGACN